MKNLNSSIAFLVLLMCCQWADSRETSPKESSFSTSGSVCFTGFEIQFLVGKTEESINSPEYCGFSIEKTKFIKMISYRPSSEFYLYFHVRAKVSFSRQDVYFIDNNGIVRSGGRKFFIDKEQFSKSLKVR